MKYSIYDREIIYFLYYTKKTHFSSYYKKHCIVTFKKQVRKTSEDKLDRNFVDVPIFVILQSKSLFSECKTKKYLTRLME